MKTLNELNDKWWYRLLKIVFLFIFAVIGIFTTLVVYDENSERQVTDYLITCNYGNEKIFVVNRDTDIYLYSERFIDTSNREAVHRECEITEEDIRVAALGNTDNEEGISFREPGDERSLFSIEKVKVTEGDNLLALVYSLLSLIGIALIFEIIRRSFYYVVLGKINPPSKKDQ